MTFINQWFVTSCIGARAVRGRSGWSDGGSDTWDIEIPAFDKASLYQTMLIFGDLGNEVSFTLSRKKRRLRELRRLVLPFFYRN
jgi:hypothetical protein